MEDKKNEKFSLVETLAGCMPFDFLVDSLSDAIAKYKKDNTPQNEGVVFMGCMVITLKKMKEGMKEKDDQDSAVDEMKSIIKGNNPSSESKE